MPGETVWRDDGGQVADSPQNEPAAVKKAPAEDAPTKKAPAKKAPAKKVAAKKAPVKKAAPKKAPAKAAAEAPTDQAPAKKAPAKKAPAKKAPVKKTAPKTLRGGETTTEARRLAGWDFATWRLATDDPIMRSTILGVLVLDQSPDWDKLNDRYERATRLAPVLRSKVVEGPTGLETPRVVVDPNFDLSFHMRRFRMPEGSTWSDVLEEARRQSMADFDKDRPLWRATLLEGLPGGKAALVQKLHHAIADGQGAVQLGLTLLDFTEEGIDPGPMPEAPEPVLLDTRGFMQAVIRNNVGWVARTAEDAIRGFGPLALAALTHPRTLFAKIRDTAGSVARFTKVSIEPLSPILKGRSINYHFDTIDMDFDKFRAAAKKRDRTVNDMFLAAISVGMHDFHEKLGYPVDELRMNMPISLRTSAEQTNAVTVARFEIPVSNIIDDVLETAAETVRSWRGEPALRLADYLAELSRFLPAELVSAAMQTSDLTASNVPGIPMPVWLAGAKVERMYPLVGTIGAAVNVTMLTYNGTASVGITSDDAAVEDRAELLESLRRGFREVVGESVMLEDSLAGH